MPQDLSSNKWIEETVKHHLTASGPCSVQSLKRYCAEQTEGTAIQIETCIRNMVKNGWLILSVPDVEWNYEKEPFH